MGIVFDDNSAVARVLRNIFDGLLGGGYMYLYRNAKLFDSITDTGAVVSDNFAQLLIVEGTQDR